MHMSASSIRLSSRMIRFILGLILPLGLAACSTSPRLGDRLPRQGDEIVIAGQYFHTGTPVVLWTDPGGYDAYRVERRFVPLDKADWDITEKEWAAKADGRVVMPNRYGMSTAQAHARVYVEGIRATLAGDTREPGCKCFSMRA